MVMAHQLFIPSAPFSFTHQNQSHGPSLAITEAGRCWETRPLLEDTASKRAAHQESSVVRLGASLRVLASSLIALMEYLTKTTFERKNGSCLQFRKYSLLWWARHGVVRWRLTVMGEDR